MNDDTITTASTQRIEEWESVVHQELQDLVQRGSTLRKNIDSSKTDTKKSYYNKKFKKVQQDVMRMLVTLRRLESMKSAKTDVNPVPATEGDGDVLVTEPSA